MTKKRGEKMPIRKRNNFSINLSNKAVFSLQVLGFLAKNKKATGRNYSGYISELISRDLNIRNPSDERHVKEKLLIFELNSLQKDRDRIESDMRKVGIELTALRESNQKQE